MEKKVKKSILKTITKVIEVEANIANSAWPPICAGLIHQPKRPKQIKK